MSEERVAGDSAPPRQFRAASLYATLAIAQRGSGLLLLPFVTRSMPVDEYGAVSVVTAASSLAAVVLGGGIEQAVVRWGVRNRASSAHAQAVLAVIARWTLWLCVPLGVLSWIASVWAEGSLLGISSRLWLLEVGAVLINVHAISFAVSLLRARERLRSFVVLMSTSLVVLLVGKTIMVVVLELGLLGWVLSDCASAILVLSVGLALARPPRVLRTAAARSEVVRFVAPLIPHVASFWILTSASRPLAASVLSLDDVGTFAVSFAAAALGPLLLAETNRALVVRYAEESGAVELSPRLRTAITVQLALACAMPGLIAAFIPIYSNVVLPANYGSTAPIVAILALSSFFYGIYLVPTNIVIQVIGNSRWSWTSSLAAGAVLVPGTLWLGASLGTVGVAIAQVLAYAALAAVAFVIMHSLWRRAPRRALTSRGGWLASLLGVSVLAVLAAGLEVAAYSPSLALAAFALIALAYRRRIGRTMSQ